MGYLLKEPVTTIYKATHSTELTIAFCSKLQGSALQLFTS